MMTEMRNIEPTAELPLVHMHKHTNAMPARNPRATQTRNLTGIYLGVDNEPRSPGNRAAIIPPLARGRGMPSHRVQTPTEQRRYYAEYLYHLGAGPEFPESCIKSYCYTSTLQPSTIPNFPAMPPSRYPLIPEQRKVEMLRSKEERRGFSGNPVKRRTKETATTEETPISHNDHQEEFWKITRQTNRAFTAANNSGVSHLEYLVPDPEGNVTSHYQRGFDQTMDSVLAREVQNAVKMRKEILGLAHCYNKICKGNLDALQHLLPTRPVPDRARDNFRGTGFSVKSYRVPQQAELLCSFPDARPKTVEGYSMNQRPLVPSPYFFKSYSPPKTAGSHPTTMYNDDIINAAPGAGMLSRSVPTGRQYTTPRVQTPQLLLEDIPQARKNVALPLAPRSTPAPDHADAGHKHDPAIEGVDLVQISLPGTDRHEPAPSPETREDDIKHAPPQETEPIKETAPVHEEPEAPMIPACVLITAEEEDGKEIDLDKEPKPEINDKDQENQSFMKSTTRQEELATLLDEHAQIMEEIKHVKLSAEHSDTNTPQPTNTIDPDTSTQQETDTPQNDATGNDAAEGDSAQQQNVTTEDSTETSQQPVAEGDDPSSDSEPKNDVPLPTMEA